MRFSILICLSMLLAVGAMGQETPPVQGIISGAWKTDSIQRSEINTLTMTAESFVRRLSGDGDVKEEKQFLKNYTFHDTALAVEFVEFYLDGVPQSEDKLRAEAEDAAKRRKEGKSRDASIRPLTAFAPDIRTHYSYNLMGIEPIRGFTCYHITAAYDGKDEEIYEGDFWIETESLHLVKAELRPSELPGPLKQLDMSFTYAPQDGWWLPQSFHLHGRGRAMLVISFHFEVEERYTDHRVNVPIDHSKFEEAGDED